jgi:F0F1-type ATP synthase assembly protein I
MRVGRVARWAAAGIEFASMPVAGALLGHYLDLYFATDPVLTLIMFLLGVLAGFIHLIRTLGEMRKES